jgi:DmsE family decaheme c-type cytochrome
VTVVRRDSSPDRSWITRVWVAVALLLFGLACVTSWTPKDDRPHHRTEPVQGATEFIGMEECWRCHGHQPAPEYHQDCEGCHGQGDVHLVDVMLEEHIRFPSNADCLGCHETGHASQLGWSDSEHARAGVLCSDCHDPHNGEPRHVRLSTELGTAMLRHASETSRMCSSCHTEVAARLEMPSHHPIREGMLGCTDCHDPHESGKTALGARTALCSNCHEDHSGPWIYEHAPVAEDCGYCHAPHGSAAYNLLETSEPGVCISCHTVPELGATHDPEAYVTRCTDCHGAVHGSYADPHLRR